MAGTWHQGHGMGHSPALHRPLRGQTAGVHRRFSYPGRTRLEAAVGYTPTGYCPCLLSAQSRETPGTSGSCSGPSQTSICSSPVNTAVSTELPTLSFFPLLSTLNYHNTALCQWACPGSVSHAASPREACNLSSALTPNFPCSNKCHRLIIHYANNFLVTLEYVVVSLKPLLRSGKKKKKYNPVKLFTVTIHYFHPSFPLHPFPEHALLHFIISVTPVLLLPFSGAYIPHLKKITKRNYFFLKQTITYFSKTTILHKHLCIFPFHHTSVLTN